MEGDQQNPAPTDAADAGASPTVAEPAAHTAPSGERKELASFDDALRSQGATARADAKAGDEAPKSADEVTDDGKPASEPSGDVTPEQPGKGRRSQNAEADKARIADLERQVAERDPEAIRQQARADFEAEQQRKAEAEATQAVADADAEEAAWYQRVRDVPDRNLSDEDYRKREDYRARLDLFPTVTKQARALARREADAVKAEHTAEAEAFWQGVHGRFGLLQTLPGVTKEKLAETDLYEIGRHLYDTGGDTREQKVRAELQPKLDAALEEVRRLKDASQQFRVNGRGGLAAARAPIAGGGRSGASSPATPDWKSSKGGDFFEAALKRDADERP